MVSPNAVQHFCNSIDGVLKCLSELAKCGFQWLPVDVTSLT